MGHEYQSDKMPLTSGCPQGSIIGPLSYNLYTAPLGRVIKRHALSYHKYADDVQIYIECDVDDIYVAKVKLENCLSEVREWLLRWSLKINDTKTEFIIFRNRQAKIPNGLSIKLGSATIQVSDHVRNLGVTFDLELSRERRISDIVRTCNYHLRQISRVRKYITQDVAKRVVHALVLGRIDYCNSVLADLPAKLTSKLQRVQNRAACIILRPKRNDNQILHATPMLKELSWLPVTLRVVFKICCLVFKCLAGCAPQYLCELLVVKTRHTRLRQPQSRELSIPPTVRRIGSSSFSVVGPTLWNQLPPELRQVNTLLTFRRHLKTHLWRSYYID